MGLKGPFPFTSPDSWLHAEILGHGAKPHPYMASSEENFVFFLFKTA